MSPTTSTPFSAPRARASSSDSAARCSSCSTAWSMRRVERHADHVQRLDGRAALLGELDRRRQHLLADQPDLHRDEDLAELGLRQLLLVRRRDGLEQPLAACPAHEVEDDQAAREPGRPCVARPRVRDHRDHEHGQRPDEADDRRQRQLLPANAHVERHAVGPWQVRRRHAQPQHRHLGGDEGEQDAEAEQAGEEDHRVAGSRVDDDEERDRDGDGGHDRLRRDVSAPAEAPERARQHPVLAERVREPPDPGDGGRDAREQDQRARTRRRTRGRLRRRRTRDGRAAPRRSRSSALSATSCRARSGRSRPDKPTGRRTRSRRRRSRRGRWP